MDADNTSGQGKNAIVPPEIRGWNWGAFLLNWIWGIGNNTFVALLMFVPVVNLVMLFVLGARGNRWAWQNRRWESVAAFKASQRKWAWWGAAFWLLSGLASFAMMSSLKSSEAYQQARQILEQDPRMSEQYGAPLSTGIPTGNIEMSGPDGAANLRFDVEGPKAEGTAYVQARRQMGQWRIEHLVVENDENGTRIDFR